MNKPTDSLTDAQKKRLAQLHYFHAHLLPIATILGVWWIVYQYTKKK